jgi:hypothetical protein
MTSDAIPANEPLRPTADARPADEADDAAPAPGVETASAEATTPEAGTEVAQASAEAVTAESAAAAVTGENAVTAEAAETVATAEAIDPAAAVDVVEANAAVAEAQAGAPAEAKTHPRRATFARGLKKLAAFAFTVALLVGGVAIGYSRYLAVQPAEQPVGDPVTSGVQPTAAVQEFISALSTNDADAIRSAVPADPYKLLTNEMERWSFGEVSAVETLSTYIDGPRTSTAVILRGTSTDGSPVAINLVIQTMDGAIVSFR